MVIHSGLGLSPTGVQIPAQPPPSSVTLAKSLHVSEPSLFSSSIKWGDFFFFFFAKGLSKAVYVKYLAQCLVHRKRLINICNYYLHHVY